MKYKISFFILLLFFAISCSNKIIVPNQLEPPVDNVSEFNAKSIAVLPFHNLTEEKNLSKLVRISFYSHLTVRAFKDIELSKVDTVLKNNNFKNISIKDKDKIEKLGIELAADYLVFGSVNANKKVYAAVYSLNSIEVEINIVDTHSGNIVWNDTIISKQHEGGFPTSILSIPFISASTGMNMKKDITFILIEDACRLLAYRIPSKLISYHFDDKSYHFDDKSYFLQAGAFSEKIRALKILKKLRGAGFPAFLKFEKKLFKVLMGPYESIIEVKFQQKRIKKNLHINTIIKLN